MVQKLKIGRAEERIIKSWSILNRKGPPGWLSPAPVPAQTRQQSQPVHPWHDAQGLQDVAAVPVPWGGPKAAFGVCEHCTEQRHAGEGCCGCPLSPQICQADKIITSNLKWLGFCFWALFLACAKILFWIFLLRWPTFFVCSSVQHKTIVSLF